MVKAEVVFDGALIVDGEVVALVTSLNININRNMTSEVDVVGDNVVTWVREGEGCILKHVTLDKVNENTVEFTYSYTPTVRYHKPSTRRAKRKSNQIILLPPF